MRLPENPLINTDINGSGNNKGNNNSSTTITRKKVKVSEIEEIEERVEDKIYTKIAMWMRRI